MQAQVDTLPGIDKLRDEYISSDDTFRILEIVSDYRAAEVGYYIAGQEPFVNLRNESISGWTSWKEKLASYTTYEERKSLMDSLKEQSTNLENALQGDGNIPFHYQDYQELTKEEAAADTSGDVQTLAVNEEAARGIFKPTVGDNAGDWNVVFKRFSNRDIALDEVNKGIETPYYVAKTTSELTCADLYALIQAGKGQTALYKLRQNEYYVYEGTVEDIWQILLLNGTVSGSDVEQEGGVVGGNTVSAGDANSKNQNPSGYTYVSFELVNNIETNQIAAGTEVYLVDMGKLSYAKTEGAYEFEKTEIGKQAGDQITIPGEVIYYKGGIISSDWFRTDVLGLDNAEERDAFEIQVDTLEPSQINQVSNFDVYDMVYMGNGSLKGLLPAVSSTYYKYSDSNDISQDALKSLFISVVKRDVPCIVDASIAYKIENQSLTYDGVKGHAWDSTLKIEKLTALLMSPSKSELLNQRQTDFVNTVNDYYVGTFMNNWNNSWGSILEGTERINWDLQFVSEFSLIFEGHVMNYVSKQEQGENANYSQEKIAGGFQAVLSEVQEENLYRKSDVSYQGTLLPETVTNAGAVRYILNYANRRVSLKKSVINILELEPATGTTQLSENTVYTWLGVTDESSVDINITTMPMTQFIGVIDDINATYDMIYIGSSTTGFTTKSNGTTDFNDNNMDGLLYSHVGDTIVEHANISGLLDTEYVNNRKDLAVQSTHRFSGNDLTLDRYNALLDYLDAFYPIVVANDLYSVTNGTEAVNPNRVDNSSYLYEFLNLKLGGTPRSNMFSVSDIENAGTMFQFYVNKPKLVMTDCQIMGTTNYVVGSGSSQTTNGAVQVLQADSVGKYYLQYKFTITDIGAVSYDTNYTCKLYLDANADGKFSEENEEVTALQVTQDGKSVDVSELKAGVEYVVTRQVPDNYFGCITWRLEVQQADNSMVRDGQQGYVKLQKSDATVIKILQIYYKNNASILLTNELYGNTPNIVRDENGVMTGAEFANTTFGSTAKKIKNDYLLDVTTISKAVYQEKFDVNNANYNPDYLDDFDMLILGFSDGETSGDWNEEGILGDKGIKAFIESGRSVLFAHDTTSLYNVPSGTSYGSNYEYRNQYFIGEYRWNYNMNRYIRDLVGMDSYGITAANDASDSQNSDFAVLKAGAGLSSDSALFQKLTPTKDENGRYIYANVKDLAYTPNSGRTSTVPQVQGYTYSILDTRCYSNYGSKSGYIKLNQKGYRSSTTKYHTYANVNNNGENAHAFNSATSTANLVNQGQITSYPFNMGTGDLDIGSTHNQYYTLDMNSDADGDNETDIVVWYTLGDNNMYTSSPKDVRNNYYIYSKGNIIYTGMGHSAATSNAYTEDEAKLFINTMIAAYQAGTKDPQITTLGDNGIETDVFYSYYDSDSLFTDESDETVLVYFNVNDMNMTQGDKHLTVKYYVENSAGNRSVTLQSEVAGKSASILTDVPLQEISLTTYYTDGNGAEVAANTLYPDREYYVKVPVKYFKVKGSDEKYNYNSEFHIYAQTVMIKSTSGSSITTATGWASKAVEYVNVELFDLD